MPPKVVGVRDITGIPVYPDLGVLRYISRYAFDLPVRAAASIRVLGYSRI